MIMVSNIFRISPRLEYHHELKRSYWACFCPRSQAAYYIGLGRDVILCIQLLPRVISVQGEVVSTHDSHDLPLLQYNHFRNWTVQRDFVINTVRLSFSTMVMYTCPSSLLQFWTLYLFSVVQFLPFDLSQYLGGI
jgi:hypothetical protein